MDQLVTALANAINTGSALAGPALFGYLAVQLLNTVAIVVGLVTVARGLFATIRYAYDENVREIEARARIK